MNTARAKRPLTYEEAGVVYKDIDSFKRLAQKAAKETQKGNPLRRLGFQVVTESRGESAFLLEAIHKREHYLSHVQEGLGTKNLVADAVYRFSGDPYGYRVIAQDTVAMIVNDMATLGTFPLSVAMHLAAGSSEWFNDDRRATALIEGFRDACIEARCVWGPGETPVLKGLVDPESFELSGSAIGITTGKRKKISPKRIESGDLIMLAPSTGVHANGLTQCRAIAERLPKKFAQRMFGSEAEELEHDYLPSADKKSTPLSFGEALLRPTPLYSVLVEDLLRAGVDVHYAVNITGHGWRKLMRAPQPLCYTVVRPPKPPESFDFIQRHASVDDRAMYGTHNMGIGFAVYIPHGDRKKAERAGRKFGLFAAGQISRSNTQEREVRIVRDGWNNITFVGEELDIR